jgi:hypothetical protein
MANTLFPSGREGFLDGSIDWDTNDVRVMLVKSTYTYDPADVFVADITPATNDNGRSAALTGKTKVAGVADAADTTVTATAAVACNALIVFQHTGSDATARLIGYIDTPASGLPFTPAASQVVPIAFDEGASKIFKL